MTQVGDFTPLLTADIPRVSETRLRPRHMVVAVESNDEDGA
jgi:hypothetical protein